MSGFFCLPGEAGKPGHLKEGGVTPTEGKTIRLARAPLVNAGAVDVKANREAIVGEKATRNIVDFSTNRRASKFMLKVFIDPHEAHPFSINLTELGFQET